MAILKKQPTKKCDSSGNVINIIAHEKEKVHEGENVKSENTDFDNDNNLEFKLIDVSDNTSEIQIKSEINKKNISTTSIQEIKSKDPLEILNGDLTKTNILEKIQITVTDLADFKKTNKEYLHLNAQLKDDKKAKPIKNNDPENYKCDPCGKIFYRKSAWNNHNQTFHQKLKEKCDYCSELFSTKIEVDDHIKKFHERDSYFVEEKKQIDCDLCERSFPSEKGLIFHKNNFHTGHFPCGLCNYAFKNRVLLEVHLEKMHKNTESSDLTEKNNATKSKKDWNYICDFCNLSFNSEATIRDHVKKIHDIEDGRKYKKWKFMCELCDFTSNSEVKLGVHLINVHRENRKSICNSCDKSFFTFSGLKNHIKTIHEGQKKLVQKCDSCKKSYSTEAELKQHIKDIHKGKNDLQKCDSEEKSYSTEAKLKKHIKNIHEGKKKLLQKCDSCEKSFPTEAKLKKHIKNTHEGKNDLQKCDIKNIHEEQNDSQKSSLTEKSHSTEAKFKRKIKNIHEEGKKVLVLNKCGLCTEIFSSAIELTNHIKSIHNLFNHKEKPRNFICDFCGNSFTLDEELKTHISTEHSTTKIKSEFEKVKKEYKCEFCFQLFKQKKKFKIHVKSTHREGKKFKCELCGKNTFWSKILLMKHTRKIHKGHKKNKCKLCPEFFPRSGLLKNHMKSVHGKENCDICDKFYDVYHLKKHIKIVHEGKNPKDEEFRFKCESCDKSFASAQRLKGHYQCVHEGKTSKCDLCDKILGEYPLKHHIRQVHIDKKLKCEFCENETTFPTVRILRKHVHSVHKGYKKHRCNKCGKCFIKLEEVQEHIQSVHDGDKKHRCDICDKPLGTIYQLKRHIKIIHEGIKSSKDFKCDSCEKSFVAHQQLRWHIQKVHEGKINKCDTCGKIYSFPSTLKQHIRLVHEGQKNKELHDHETCDESFLTAAEAREHIQKYHILNRNRNGTIVGPFSNSNESKASKKVENKKKPSLQDPTIKNTNYIRKRKPINFTMADLEADQEKNDDEEYDFEHDLHENPQWSF